MDCPDLISYPWVSDPTNSLIQQFSIAIRPNPIHKLNIKIPLQSSNPMPLISAQSTFQPPKSKTPIKNILTPVHINLTPPLIILTVPIINIINHLKRTNKEHSIIIFTYAYVFIRSIYFVQI